MSLGTSTGGNSSFLTTSVALLRGCLCVIEIGLRERTGRDTRGGCHAGVDTTRTGAGATVVRTTGRAVDA